MRKEYDVVIVGGGNAGFGVSSVVAEANRTIAFVEQQDFGGTCPNRGCTPKKVLVAAAQALDEISRAKEHAITVSQPSIDWSALINRKDEMIGFIPDAMQSLAKKRGDTYRGSGRFVGSNEIQVGNDVLSAKNIIVATGSRPRPLSFPGANHLITSSEVLSQTELPQKVVFVGGGVVALEFGHVYARAGVEVTILEVMPRLLPRHDEGAVEKLSELTRSLGIDIVTGVAIEEVEEVAGRLQVRYVADGQEACVRADRVVNGAGRVANVEGLDLERGGVDFDGVRILVEEHLQSVSNRSVWVAGDALVGSAQLSPLATYEGQVVGRNIVNSAQESPDYFAVPSAVYTIPSFATLGDTEAQAREKVSKLRVAENDMTGWFSGKSYAEKLAWSKVLIDEDSDQIVGAHMIGHHADDLVHLFALAMKNRIAVSDLKKQIFAFPSFASDVKNLL